MYWAKFMAPKSHPNVCLLYPMSLYTECVFLNCSCLKVVAHLNMVINFLFYLFIWGNPLNFVTEIQEMEPDAPTNVNQLCTRRFVLCL